ncbi:unnamed protein product [Caenorhabditis angaria]|uniref:Uncharacterized protein n=1 Tax=Caenorhabditis angaria TaxID=860376 RepID=A0A9P1IZ90_9PELO|nr:unnamed protein product [Caenorhabditis angaria]
MVIFLLLFFLFNNFNLLQGYSNFPKIGSQGKHHYQDDYVDEILEEFETGKAPTTPKKWRPGTTSTPPPTTFSTVTQPPTSVPESASSSADAASDTEIIKKLLEERTVD